MNISSNTQNFLSKLAKTFNVNETRSKEILLAESLGSLNAELKDGEVTYLSTWGMCLSKKDLAQKIDNVRIDADILNCSHFDISDLLYLKKLHFNAHRINTIENDAYHFPLLNALEVLEFKNQLSSAIDLEQFPAIKTLDVSKNRFTQLDLSKNVQIENIICQSNKLTIIDLKNNPLVDSLNCASNKLHNNSIVFCKPEKIEHLAIQNNYFTEFNLSGFSKLKSLRIGNPDLKKIDIATNIHLQTLFIFNSNLTDLNISTNQSLNELKFIECKIDTITCTKFHAFAIPELKSKIKIKPTSEQLEFIKIVDLHHTALKHNWDEGLNPLKKILKNPLCDRATATAIYWMGRPNYFLQFHKVSEVPEPNKELYRFLNKLEKDILDNIYTNNIIRISPTNFGGNNWVEDSYEKSKSVKEIDQKLKAELLGSNLSDLNLDEIISIKFS